MNRLWIPLLVVFALVCTLPQAAQAQDLFPDKQLEAVVRQYVFEKRNSQDPLVEDDVKNISTISGKGKGITNLQGLEKCYSLALLDLADNQIEDISQLKELKNLQSLDLSKNKIKDLAPLSGLTGLQFLSLADNQIADAAALSPLENLRTLYLSNNQLTTAEPLAKLAKIWSLYLDGNQVQDLKPLANLKDLSSLDVARNGISDLSPLAELTELRYLILDNNEISDLGVLVAMAKKDSEGEKRFAPFLRIYLRSNPLSDEAKGKQIEELRGYGCRVFLEMPEPGSN